MADTLRQLHQLTQGWPQRPGWRSSTDLLHADTGTKIDLRPDIEGAALAPPLEQRDLHGFEDSRR